MAVPVTPGERITDLRKARGWDQKTLAENSGLSESQISRIENGKIGKLSHDILIKLAKVFHVSTDYILGLTTVSVPKSYDISELGLSEGDGQCGNPQPPDGTQEFSPAAGADTDIFFGYGGNGNHVPQ